MFFFFFFFFKSCKDVRVLSQQMLGKMLGIGVVSPAVTLSGWILIDLKRLPEHQLRISFVCFFYFYLFKSLSENFCCYRSLHWHQRATEESSFGIELHYSAVSRKKAGQNTKVSLDRGHAAVGRRSESEENTNLFVAPHFAPACEAEGAVLNPIAPSLSFMPEYIKTNSSLNCFHTEMKLLISYDSTF